MSFQGEKIFPECSRAEPLHLCGQKWVNDHKPQAKGRDPMVGLEPSLFTPGVASGIWGETGVLFGRRRGCGGVTIVAISIAPPSLRWHVHTLLMRGFDCS